MPTSSVTLAACSDEELAERVQQGCAESFAELDRRLRPRLLYVLMRRLPRREDAEDVLQQTLLRVYEKIHLYDVRQRLSPWVFTIALRLAAQWGRRKALPVRQETESPLEIVDTAAGPHQRVSGIEERDYLWQLADRVLKKDQWTALWLFYGEEQSLLEIAQTMGRTRTSVSVLLFRARKALLPHLNQLAATEAPSSRQEVSSRSLLLSSYAGTEL